MQDKVGQIGEVINGTVVSNKISSGSLQMVNKITLPPGKWIVECYAAFGGSSTGFRQVYFNGKYVYSASAFSGSANIIRTCSLVISEQEYTYNLLCYQNSGNELSVISNLQATRLS